MRSSLIVTLSVYYRITLLLLSRLGCLGFLMNRRVPKESGMTLLGTKSQCGPQTVISIGTRVHTHTHVRAHTHF